MSSSENMESDCEVTKMRASIYANIEDYNYGTAFYSVTEDQLQNYYDNEENIIIRYLVNEYGFEAFDIERLYGSAIIDDVLYICDTNGEEILVGGQSINPEDALENFTLDELSTYVIPADDSIIKRYLSEYELAEFDLDDVAYDLIDGTTTFSDVAKWADKMGLLQDILY